MPTATKEHKEVMAERNIEIRDRLLKFGVRIMSLI